MIKIGQYNKLTVERFVDFGAFLTDGESESILLPSKYIDQSTAVGDEVEVFVYKDSEDRPVAVTEHPFACVGEVAFLQVAAVNKYGAFLDWGLPKDLLVPFSEQKSRMREGGFYPVYVYLDDETKRVVASAKLEKFIGNTIPDYRPGQKVEALVIQHTEIGYKVVVDNLHWGMIYDNEVFAPLEIEQSVKAYVKSVRDDGKIDLTLNDKAKVRTKSTAELIIEHLKANGGEIAVGDKSSPEEIKALFHCSKKDFKKALGALYKDKKIIPGDNLVKLNTDKQ